ncbi:MAG: sigma-70 family RNA polymerase sigma factor [Planctomycetota bacterium]
MAPDRNAEELIADARSGCGEALNELLSLYRAQVRYEAGMRLEGSLGAKLDGSDAAQNVLLRATERFDQFRGDSAGEFAAWLRTILNNHLRDEQRRYLGETRSVAREVPIEDTDWVDENRQRLAVAEATGADVNAEQRELSLQVANALERMPERAREVLLMRNYEQLEWAEIARRLKTTPDAARMRWSRALHQLGIRLRR